MTGWPSPAAGRTGSERRRLYLADQALAILFVSATIACVAVPSEAVFCQEEEPPAQGDSEPNQDGRRSLKKLPVSLGRGFIGVFSGHSAAPLVLGAVATVLSRPFDDDLLNADREENRLGRLGADLGDPAYVGPLAVALLAGGRLATGQRFRDASYDVFVATAVNLGYTEALKVAVGRTRPDGQDRRSFPSGHTSNAFTWATVAERHYGRSVGLPMYLLASLVGASRISQNRHHLSDVLAGSAIGFIVGRSVTRQNGMATAEPAFSLLPAVGPSGQRGLLAVFRF